MTFDTKEQAMDGLKVVMLYSMKKAPDVGALIVIIDKTVIIKTL